MNRQWIAVIAIMIITLVLPAGYYSFQGKESRVDIEDPQVKGLVLDVMFSWEAQDRIEAAEKLGSLGEKAHPAAPYLDWQHRKESNPSVKKAVGEALEKVKN